MNHLEIPKRFRFVYFARAAVLLSFFGCSLKPANEARFNSLLHPEQSQGSSTPTPTPTATPTATPVLAITIVPDGIVAHGYVYASCQIFSSISSIAPLPLSGGGGEVEFFGTDYPNLATVDGIPAIHECNESFGSNTQIVEFSWDVSVATAALYTKFSLSWTGREGYHSGGCNGGPPVFLFTPLPMQIYNGTNWVDLLQTPLNTISTISQQIDIPSNYIVSNKIWVRLYAEAATGNCATIQTDSISLTLTP